MRAPMIIPTLSRYEHFVRCIESLKKNTQFMETEFYISVDYPASEKHYEGHKKITNYLAHNIADKFENMHIFYQKSNLGPYQNYKFLRQQISKKYDCCIYSEDDNEFSPNFLEYINEGLMRYQDDQSILAICGYRDEKKWENGNCNVEKVSEFCAWGYATWMNKLDKCERWINRDNLKVLLKDGGLCKWLYKNRYKSYFILLEALLASPNDKSNVYINEKGNIQLMDHTIELYLIANQKTVIVPKISKVRNWGFDGSGVNCREIRDNNPEEKEIDKEATFCYIMDNNETRNKVLRENEYLYYTKKANIYRKIILVLGLPFARKVYNAQYKLECIMK